MTEEGLKEAFKEHGEIKSVKVIKDFKTKKPKGAHQRAQGMLNKRPQSMLRVVVSSVSYLFPC